VLNMRIDKVYGRIDEVYGRIDDVSGGLNTARENTKLLHTLAHNLVVELTKLRIEYETLKSKMRIMEKDFEVLGKREKALEKRVIE
jgi:regulator of replication initiation timing